MQERILIVEDDPTLADCMQRGLRQAGYDVDVVLTGEESLDALSRHRFDLAILDMKLPGGCGLDILRGLRRNRVDVPVLAVSARNTVDDRVRGLDAGCDDYLGKPFAFAELLARIRALRRRTSGAANSLLQYRDLRLELATRVAVRGRDRIPLSNREFALLDRLLRCAETVVPRTHLLHGIWGISTAESNVLEVHINALRRKIDGGRARKLLHTVRGTGYILCDALATQPQLGPLPASDP